MTHLKMTFCVLGQKCILKCRVKFIHFVVFSKFGTPTSFCMGDDSRCKKMSLKNLNVTYLF